MTRDLCTSLSMFFLGSMLLFVGCAGSKAATSEGHGKQFTTMWEEIYGRLKPEIDSGNISVERGGDDSPRIASNSAANTGDSGVKGAPSLSTNGRKGVGPDSPGTSPSSAAGGGAGSGDISREYIRIRLTDRVLFDSGDDRIKPEGVDVLARLGRILKEEQGLDIVIEGHTDNVPIRERLRSRFPDNMALSQARATSAAQILGRSGVTGDGLWLQWFGDSRPIRSNDSEDRRRRNRRVEIMITPK